MPVLKSRGVPLSGEQGNVFDSVLRGLGGRQVQTVGGYAGTGKTVLVGALADALPGFAVCAFTGKAAHVLRRKGVAEASTIHSLIYRPADPPPESTRPGEKPPTPPPPVFILRDPDEVTCEGFLVDEASMVSADLYDDLLSFGLPTVFVGDHGQLPPVGDKNVYLMAEPDHRLETIHRNAGPVARFAEYLRQGGNPRCWPGGGEAVRVMHKGALTDRALLSADQIICAFNATRVAMNKRVRDLLGRASLVEPGDRVICLRNSRAAGLFNGMQGTVSEVRPEVRHGYGEAAGPWLSFEDDDGRRFDGLAFDPQQFGQKTYRHDPYLPHPFDYAHCVTCHKAQGSEWPHVLCLEQYWPDAPWEHRRWTYTAASRAQERLTWVY
jgi:exodeoxyribonuclease-5